MLLRGGLRVIHKLLLLPRSVLVPVPGVKCTGTSTCTRRNPTCKVPCLDNRNPESDNHASPEKLLLNIVLENSGVRGPEVEVQAAGHPSVPVDTLTGSPYRHECGCYGSFSRHWHGCQRGEEAQDPTELEDTAQLRHSTWLIGREEEECHSRQRWRKPRGD